MKDDLEVEARHARSALRLGFLVRPSPPLPDGLIHSINEISYKPAREDALAILRDKTFLGVDGETLTTRNDKGLVWAVITAKGHLRFQAHGPKPKGPAQVAKELEELAENMRRLAGGLNHLSSSAAFWLDSIPGWHDETPEELKVLWEDCGAKDAFESKTFADRLEGMIKILEAMGSRARDLAKAEPGNRQLFRAPPADLGLFESCAQILTCRGRSLENLRPISETLYRFVTGSSPVDFWAKRQEEEARRKYGTYPPKNG